MNCNLKSNFIKPKLTNRNQETTQLVIKRRNKKVCLILTLNSMWKRFKLGDLAIILVIYSQIKFQLKKLNRINQRPPIRKGRPFKNPVITINRKQPEPKDIKSVIRKWRKFMQEDFPQNNKNPNQNLLSVLEQFGLNEQQRLKALLFSQGFHRENCLKNQDGIPIIGSSIKKEITEEREHEDIIGLLISRYNLRRLQKFFKKRIHRVAFRFYEMAISDDFNLIPFPENETLLKALKFIISISDLMETHTP
eukprot:403334394